MVTALSGATSAVRLRFATRSCGTGRKLGIGLRRGKFGCDGWSGGAGFIIHGHPDEPEIAQSVWGMHQFGVGEIGADFSSLTLWVR